MADFKYFTECGGQAVELKHVWHSGNGTRAQHFTGTCPACNATHTASRKIEYKSQPSKHECNAKCTGASGRSMVCECKCGGLNHGRGFSVAA